MEKLKKGVFIIEAISHTDIGQELPILQQLLKMFGAFKESFLVKEQTTKEEFLENLLKNKFRFIHISAHGGKGILFIHKTPITRKDIENFCRKNNIENPLKNKFLTISACGEISASFVKTLHETTKVTATIYPLTEISFSDAALFMTIFYYSLLKHPAMNQNLKTSKRIAHFVDAFQKAKLSFLQLEGTGCFRLDYWWNNEHIYIF